MSKICVELEPIRVPNFIIQRVLPGKREDGFMEAPKYAVGALDADTIGELCDEFRSDMFAKAGMSDPALREKP
jgi:hypothetical protein